MKTKQTFLDRILFLQNKIKCLDEYLPETYDFLQSELDSQIRNLSELEVREAYDLIDTDIDTEN